MASSVLLWLMRRKWILVGIALPVLVVGWWWFRPEKLWVNAKVNEPAPFASSDDSQPLYTGLLAGNAHQTSGRASIYKSADGKQSLRLTNFATSNGPDVHVLLARSDDDNLRQDIVKGPLDSLELGPLKGNQGDQNYDLPSTVDLQKYNAVVIYCERFHAVFGVAKLEQF
jgi:Electron transfer DM13